MYLTSEIGGELKDSLCHGRNGMSVMELEYPLYYDAVNEKGLVYGGP